MLAPSYKSPSDDYLSNPYVKSFSLSDNQIVLDDDVDTYIFAERINADEPSETFVKFTTSSNYQTSSSNVLIGQVTTRSGLVSKIDESLSFRLTGNSGTIAELGKELVESHVHGGSNEYDPPKIQLKTDIRTGIPLSKANGIATYSIASTKTTGTTSDHKHVYYVDESGDGYTTSIVGNYEFHYHKISNWETYETIINYDSLTVVDHEHTITQDDSFLSSDSSYKVYINGTETEATNYSIDIDSGKIKI